MIRPIILSIVALTLAGCGHMRQPERVLVPVTVEASFYDPAICVWPDRDNKIVAGTDEELADYILSGFEAWACERRARLGAGERQSEIVRGITRP